MKSMAMTTIGDRIKRARSERASGKVSRKELASAAGIAYSTLADIENGYSTSTTVLHKIAKRLGTRVEWLETGKGPRESQVGDQLDGDTHASLLAYGAIALPHVAGYDNEAGPANLAFPVVSLAGLGEEVEKRNLGWLVNPTDSMGEIVPKGSLVLVDQSIQQVSGNGIYAIRLFGQPSVMRVQIRGEGALRVMGSNRFDDSVDLYGEQVESLSVGGLVVGYIDRVKLIE